MSGRAKGSGGRSSCTVFSTLSIQRGFFDIGFPFGRGMICIAFDQKLPVQCGKGMTQSGNLLIVNQSLMAEIRRP